MRVLSVVKIYCKWGEIYFLVGIIVVLEININNGLLKRKLNNIM